MLISIVFIIIYILFCSRNNSVWILVSFLVLCPFHDFISNVIVLVSGDKGIFPLWREIAIISIFIKTKAFRYVFSKGIVSIFIIYILIFCILFWGKYTQNLSFTRLYLSYAFLLIGVSYMKFDGLSLRFLFKGILLSSILVSLSGLIQYFLIREQLHILMDDYVVDSGGTLMFKVPNWTIMGIERMAGFVGIPNTFGLTTAFFSYLVLAVYIGKNSFYKGLINKDDKYFFLFALSLSIVCLIFSFSRTGWALFLISIFTFVWRTTGNSLKNVKYTLYLFAILFVLIFISLLIIPDVVDVFISSINGTESSSANRSEHAEESFYLIKDFWGDGLGATDLMRGVYYAESAVLNMIFEMGIIGISLWIFFLMQYYFKCKSVYLYVFSSLIPMSIISMFPQSNILQPPYVYFLHICAGLSVNKSLLNYAKSINRNSHL